MHCYFLLQGIFPTQGLNLPFPHWPADSLSAEPPGKPKNTGVGSLSLLQGNFPTQKSNWGLLHCRWILYQLSHLGSLSDNIQETETLQGKVCTLMELKQTEIQAFKSSR